MYSWSKNSLLHFHPDKFYSINICNKSKQHCHRNYKIVNKDLEKKSVIKNLGTIVDKNLLFSNHNIHKVNKANKIMGIIGRTMVYLDKHNFSLLYKSLVWSHLEYGNVVWSPFLKSDITLIENVQRRATRYVSDIDKLEYQGRLEALNLPTLQYRRCRVDMIEKYKITHGHFKDNTYLKWNQQYKRLSIWHQNQTFKHNYQKKLLCISCSVRLEYSI